MKKLFLLLLLPLLLGQVVRTQFPATVAWDAAVGATSYEVLLAPAGDKTAATVLGETALLEYTISSVSYGDWVVGVRSVKTVGVERVSSAISWSDASAAAPTPFILRRTEPPAAPSNVRLK